MTEKEIKMSNKDIVPLNFKTSFGSPEYSSSERAPSIFNKAKLTGIFAKTFSTLNLILGLQQSSHTIRFATGTSLETVVHFALHRICNFLGVSHSITDALEVVFFITIILLATNMILEILEKTITLSRSLFHVEKKSVGETNREEKQSELQN